MSSVGSVFLSAFICVICGFSLGRAAAPCLCGSASSRLRVFVVRCSREAATAGRQVLLCISRGGIHNGGRWRNHVPPPCCSRAGSTPRPPSPSRSRRGTSATASRSITASATESSWARRVGWRRNSERPHTEGGGDRPAGDRRLGPDRRHRGPQGSRSHRWRDPTDLRAGEEHGVPGTPARPRRNQ